jgi:hypothetical protein
MSSDADGDVTDEEEEEVVGGMWELTKIYTVKELKKSKPIMCSTEVCNLVALVGGSQLRVGSHGTRVSIVRQRKWIPLSCVFSTTSFVF